MAAESPPDTSCLLAAGAVSLSAGLGHPAKASAAANDNKHLSRWVHRKSRVFRPVEHILASGKNEKKRGGKRRSGRFKETVFSLHYGSSPL
jgi:hypothetical protein